MTHPILHLPLLPLSAQSSRTEQVAHTLKSAILSGALTPGQALVERDIAQALGISKTPVREALKGLEASGLVQRTTYQSMRVRRLDVAELKNLAEVRVLLEPRALETALDTGVHPNAGEARRSMDAAERALGRDDQTLVTQANRAFHRLLYSGTPNAYLCGLLDELQDLLAFYGLAGWGQMPPSQIELQEHEEILKLVEAREGEQAAHAMMLHISRSTDRLLEAFPSETRLIEGDVPQVL